MSVNSGSSSLNPILRNNINQIIQRRRAEEENPSNTAVNTECEVQIGSEVYRAQYLTNPQSQMYFSSERANNNPQAMQEVYEIDKEAFAQIDSYESYEDFINLVNSNNLSTYVVKDDNGTILGYYQLEPVKDGDLYIDSMGLKPEYRMTRKGANAIKYSWKEILNQAKSNNAQTLSLHVDASNRSLVRMYQNLGFTISETLNNYYENGSNAYFMTRPVENSSEISQGAESVSGTSTTIQDEPIQEEPQPQEIIETVEVEVPVVSAEEQEKILLENKKEQAKEELISMGVEEGRIGFLLDACVITEGKTSTFNDDLFTCCRYLINLEKEYPNSKAFSSGKVFNSSDYISIMKALKETDDYGNVQIRTDALPYISNLVLKNCPQSYLCDILKASKESEKNNEDNSKISLEALNFAVSVVDKIDNTNSISDLIEVCKLQNDGRKVFSEEVASVARNGLDSKNSITEFHTGIKYLISASIVQDEEGNETFKKELFDKIKYQVTHWETIPYEKAVFLSAYSAQRAKSAGCDIETYLNFGKEIERGNFIYKIPEESREKLKNKEDGFKYAIFKACCYRYNGFSGDYGKIERKVGFDNSVYNLIKELITSNPPQFEDVTIVPKLINACRTLSSSWGKGDYSFNREVFDKAMELKEAGVHEAYIPEIIEACKLSKYLTYDNGKLDKKEFSQEIYDKVLADVKAGIHVGNIIGALICSVDTIKDQDVFNVSRYNELKKNYICVSRTYGDSACALL